MNKNFYNDLSAKSIHDCLDEVGCNKAVIFFDSDLYSLPQLTRSTVNLKETQNEITPMKLSDDQYFKIRATLGDLDLEP